MDVFSTHASRHELEIYRLGDYWKPNETIDTLFKSDVTYDRKTKNKFRHNVYSTLKPDLSSGTSRDSGQWPKVRELKIRKETVEI